MCFLCRIRQYVSNVSEVEHSLIDYCLLMDSKHSPSTLEKYRKPFRFRHEHASFVKGKKTSGSKHVQINSDH